MPMLNKLLFAFQENPLLEKKTCGYELRHLQNKPQFCVTFFLLTLRPVSIHNAIKLALVDLNIPANRPTNH
jgi:hypothetical protein